MSFPLPQELEKQFIYWMPRTDLLAKTFKILVNHSERKIYVSGLIRNVGYETVRGPFLVAIGIIVPKAGVTYTIQELIEVPESITIPPGVEYEVGNTSCELLYRDEDNNAVYTFELLVDVNHEIDEDNRGNNHIYMTHWFVSPTVAAQKKPLKLQWEEKVSPQTPSVPIPPPKK